MNGKNRFSTFGSWHKKYDQPERFKLLPQFGDKAVLDKETGLVWERTPSGQNRTWLDAIGYVYNKNIGGRLGWRLPAIEELASLVDPTQTTGPFLPLDHPFDVLTGGQVYYSATTLHSSSPPNAFAMRPYDGSIVTIRKDDQSGFVWCCRTGYGHEPDLS